MSIITVLNNLKSILICDGARTDSNRGPIDYKSSIKLKINIY